MMRTYLVIFSLLLTGLSFSSSGQQEPNDADGEIRYVSDNLYTFLHAGPGRNYRILGSVEAGSRVMELQRDEDAGFVEVIDDKQRTGWVDATFITGEPSIRETLPRLEERLKDAEDTMDRQQQNNEELNQQISDLTAQNTRLNNQLSEIQKRNSEIQMELSTKDKTAQMQWFTRGGIVALVSIILGVIIAYLPKKRRRNDQWM